MIKKLKLENIENHNYFIQTVNEIQSQLGFNYTIEEVEKKCLDEGYLLYFKNKKTKKWHLGIWAVGEWDIKSQWLHNGEVETYKSGYGIEHYKPLSISVFLIHDWTYDKFRPTSSDFEIVLEKKDKSTNIEEIIKQLKYIFKNPLDSYYNIVDEESYNFQHKENDKYIAYTKGYWRNEIVPFYYKWRKRINGYIATKFVKTIAHIDRRVHYVTHKFHKDKWNAEYKIAIVFKYGKSDWHDWKVWKQYSKLCQKLKKITDYNIDIDFNYLDEDGNMPKNIWRGIYWEEEPPKYYDNEEEIDNNN